MRVCGAGIALSASCSEMQPTQAALHFGATGIAASPRSRKTFCAVKQPYSRAQTLSCASVPVARIGGEPRCDDRFEFARGETARLPILAFVGPHRRDRESSSTTHANV